MLWSRRLLATAAVLALGAPLAAAYASSAKPSGTASPVPAGVIAPGVSVAGVPVGGMTPAQAALLGAGVAAVWGVNGWWLGRRYDKQKI